MDVRSSSRWCCAAPVIVAMWVPGAFAQYRTIDGTDNNPTHPDWGAAGIPLIRIMPNQYDDLISLPAGPSRPSARAISNDACDQATSVPNGVGATDMVWQWGQFVDHDIDLTVGADPLEEFHIDVPLGDPFFDPFSTGIEQIFLGRSVYEPTIGLVPRQQLNGITAFIDASNVYGSDPVRVIAVRTNDGTGRLRMSEHRLLPFNEEGLPNAGGPDPTLHLAGDVRANEQLGLTALHTLFVREHNRLVAMIWEEDPSR